VSRAGTSDAQNIGIDDIYLNTVDPPAAIFFYSRDRAGLHPQRHLTGNTSILQADAYGGFNDLYRADRRPGPITEAACWAHYLESVFM
jgi:transposase